MVSFSLIFHPAMPAMPWCGSWWLCRAGGGAPGALRAGRIATWPSMILQVGLAAAGEGSNLGEFSMAF